LSVPPSPADLALTNPGLSPGGQGSARLGASRLTWFRQGFGRSLVQLTLVVLVLVASPLGAQAAEAEAVFAGGCFWCLEHDLAQVKGLDCHGHCKFGYKTRIKSRYGHD